MGEFDPRTRTNEQLQKEVDSGKIDAFKRSDAGGIYKYKELEDGSTLIKDIEPANNSKKHQQTDFKVKGGYITDIIPHRDDD